MPNFCHLDLIQKCCLNTRIELSECNYLQNHGFQRFHQVTANFGKLLQSFCCCKRFLNAPKSLVAISMSFFRHLLICLRVAVKHSHCSGFMKKSPICNKVAIPMSFLGQHLLICLKIVMLESLLGCCKAFLQQQKVQQI